MMLLIDIIFRAMRFTLFCCRLLLLIRLMPFFFMLIVAADAALISHDAAAIY